MFNSCVLSVGKLWIDLFITWGFCSKTIFTVLRRGISLGFTQELPFFVPVFIPKQFIYSCPLNNFYTHYPQPLLFTTTKSIK